MYHRKVTWIWLLSVAVVLYFNGDNSRGDAFNVADYTHYLDYLPYRQQGFASFEGFLTSQKPPIALRDRKMDLGPLKLDVDEVLGKAVWPKRWPYSSEDFRPLDYSYDDVINTGATYQLTQSMIMANKAAIFPGVSLPIKRHFIFPKDKVALAEHLKEDVCDEAKVLELFSCYESILPGGVELGPTVGVGWYSDEMRANAALDDFIEQDITVDPFLPLADNYFDYVVMPAMFQLLQRPLDMFKEINRVLKPGGVAYIGVKLPIFGFLNVKQGRYYVETNYLEDILAVGSFFHYAEGFNKAQAFDLTLPELNVVGKLKDALCPSPRLDFYACVQAKKRKDSPHGKDVIRDPNASHKIEGIKYRPKPVKNPNTDEIGPGVFL